MYKPATSQEFAQILRAEHGLMNFRYLGPPGDGKLRRCQSDRSQKMGLSRIFQPYLAGSMFIYWRVICVLGIMINDGESLINMDFYAPYAPCMVYLPT